MLIAVGVFARNGWFPQTDALTGERTGWFGRKSETGAIATGWFSSANPTPTPQLSKEYIYAGSRLLAVEDANANAVPPADLAVWRPSDGTFYVMGGPGSQQTSQGWGMAGDIPVQGDYDGDGKTDFCVFRPSDNNWYIINSSDGSITTISFAAAGDIPAPADYDGDGSGARVKKVTNTETTVFVYDAFGKLIAEYSTQVSPEPRTSYLTTDHLGSLRVITDGGGGAIARRDFMPFGEEVLAGVGGRTSAQGYGGDDEVRKKFTGYERDDESGLDFAQARYFKPTHGRFTSPDEFKGGPDELFDFEEDASDNPTFYADLTNPQSLNKYQYGYNNPYKYNDPTGHCPTCKKAKPAVAAPLLIPALMAAAAILTGPDTVNAPGPGDPVYRNERGANAILILVGGKSGEGLFSFLFKSSARNKVVKETAKQTAITG